MSRPPTLSEALETLRTRDRRQGRLERAWKLRLSGWSHDLVMMIWNRHAEAASTVESYAEELNPHFHGLIPPFTTPKAGRQRAAPKVLDFYKRYQES